MSGYPLNKGYLEGYLEGYFGWLVPTEFGGQGIDYTDYIQRLRYLAQHDGGLAVAVSVHHSVCVLPLVLFGTAAQQNTWLPLLAKGPGWGAFALTEPSSGSDATAARLKADPLDNDQFALNGEKLFITNALNASLFVVFAQLNGRMTGFLLPNPYPGLSVQPGDAKLGLTTSNWGSLHLDNVVLGPDAMLGNAGAGFDIARAVLGGGRIGIAAISLGLADRCLAHWMENKDKNAMTQSRLAHWTTQLAAASALVKQAIQCKQSVDETLVASMAKAMASQVSFALAQETMERFELFHQPQHPVCLAWADAKAMEIVEGTSEIQRLVIAKQLLK